MANGESGILLSTKAELIEKFGAEEYVVLALMLGISAGIGVFFWFKGKLEERRSARKLQTTTTEADIKYSKEFHHHQHTATILLGGRNMGTVPMTLSLVASFMSAITLLGTPAEMYTAGTQYVALILCYPFAMAATASFYMPVFHDLGVWTSYEYLEWRFNRAVRILCSFGFSLHMIFYMAIVVYAPALALSQITGFQVDLACGIIYLVCIFYTAMGGIKAVMWTDTFQAVMMFGSFLAVIIKGNYDAGGANKVFDLNYQTNRIELFNFDTDMTSRHTIWGLIIGGYFTWASLYATNQTQVQRYLSVKKKSQAKTAIWWNMLGIAALLLMCAYAGLVIFAYFYSVACDPLKIKLVDKKDQLFPLFVMQVMGDIPCIPGLFVAGVFSGALSTVSSGLNSLAAVTLQDFIVSTGCISIPAKRKPLAAKILAVIYGIISYVVIWVVKLLPGVLEAALSFHGSIGGPILGAFTLGMFFPWANSVGTFCGTLISLIVSLWISTGQNISRNLGFFPSTSLETSIEGCPADWIANITAMAEEAAQMADTSTESSFPHLKIYEVSYIWFSAIPCMLCIVIGMLVSLVTKPQDPKKLDPRLISPGFRTIFSWWPAPIANYFKHYDIGSQFCPGAKEARLHRHQTAQPAAAEGKSEAYPCKEKGGAHNQAFQMEPNSKQP